jgi:hypothetical protein
MVCKGVRVNTYMDKSKIKRMHYVKSFTKISTSSNISPYTKHCMTIGFFEGRGSWLGADLEVMPFGQIGIQAGAGYIGFDCGINYHFKPTTKSSFISVQYYHQGFGFLNTQTSLGPSFVWRGKKWLTAQLGLGFRLKYGPQWEGRDQVPVMLTYALGVYIPN